MYERNAWKRQKNSEDDVDHPNESVMDSNLIIRRGQRTAGALVLRFEVLDVRRRPRHLPVPAETALAVLTLGTIVGYSGATMPQVTGAELGTKGGSSSAQGYAGLFFKRFRTC